MAHKLYENIVLESQINDILETKLNTQSFMTIDNDLQAEAGMTKRINRYTYEGNVEKVAMGGVDPMFFDKAYLSRVVVLESK